VRIWQLTTAYENEHEIININDDKKQNMFTSSRTYQKRWMKMEEPNQYSGVLVAGRSKKSRYGERSGRDCVPGAIFVAV
jgi:hypothetical protein